MEQFNARDIMADAKFYESYSRYLEDEGRYETWDEAINRVMDMHKRKYSDKMCDELSGLIQIATDSYKNKEVLGAQRMLQFGGDQIFSHNMRSYNCTASYCDRPRFFGEFMYVLLCGAGAGFSVQKHHIEKLPNIKHKTGVRAKTFVIPDSIEGWAEAVDVLMSSYFEDGGKHPEYRGCHISFDYSKVRPKGAFISGGFKAPGPEPLRNALGKVEDLLSKATESQTRLSPINAYDICMHIADSVIAGGVRRSATICLFSKNDEEMLKAKTGNWFNENPQRARSNNSAVLKRNSTTKEEFESFIDSIRQFGEPGVIFTDNIEFLFNPCV